MYSMVSTGIHTNGSQFYLSLGKTMHLNGRCMVFGRVIQGIEVLDVIEKVNAYQNVYSYLHEKMIIFNINLHVKVLHVQRRAVKRNNYQR